MRPKSLIYRYRGRVLSGLLSVLLLAMVAVFFYIDRNGALSRTVQSFGMGGVVSAVLVMALFCVTPIPSEGLLIMYFKVYGVLAGAFYAWSGFMLASFIVFAVSRIVGMRLVQAWVSAERFQTIDNWVTKRGVFGLFIARLLPVPALIVNIITGILPSVSFWNYTWTGAVTILPYYAAVASMYIGATGKNIYVFLIAVPLFASTWFVSLWARRKGQVQLRTKAAKSSKSQETA